MLALVPATAVGKGNSSPESRACTIRVYDAMENEVQNVCIDSVLEAVLGYQKSEQKALSLHEVFMYSYNGGCEVVEHKAAAGSHTEDDAAAEIAGC